MDDDKTIDGREQSLLYLDLIKMSYQIEEKREEAFTLEAGRMQSAFSFVIAGVVMLVTPVLNEYTGSFPFVELYFMFASIIGLLVLSLVFATIALQRRKRKEELHVDELKDLILSGWHYDKDANIQRTKTIADTIAKMVPPYRKNNDEISKWVSYSRITFFISIGIAFCWFVVITFQVFF